MKTTGSFLLLALAFAATGSAALAQSAPRPEHLIKWRQSAFQVVAWNSERIKASLDAGYDKDQVLRSANAIAAIANAGLGSLFPPGTETGKGWHETSVKADAFTNAAKFAEHGGAFAREAGELLRRVSSGADTAAVKDQFGKLQKTCKSCHDDFRNAN